MPIDRKWFDEIATPGWQQRWLENFTMNQAGFGVDVDLVNDGWTDLARASATASLSCPPTSARRSTCGWRMRTATTRRWKRSARAERLVKDKDKAEKLKAWYRQLCKRPCFHDAYLDAFNNPATHLIDTDGKGVERITEKGVVVAGKEYEVDCIVFASGFEVGTPLERRAGFDLEGRGRSAALAVLGGRHAFLLHGINVHGFPNVPRAKRHSAHEITQHQRRAHLSLSGTMNVGTNYATNMGSI